MHVCIGVSVSVCVCVCVCVMCMCNVWECMRERRGKSIGQGEKKHFTLLHSPQKSKPKAVHFQSNFSAGIDTGTNGAEFINFL